MFRFVIFAKEMTCMFASSEAKCVCLLAWKTRQKDGALVKFAYCSLFLSFNLMFLSSASFRSLIPAEKTKGRRTFDQSFCTILIMVQRSTLPVEVTKKNVKEILRGKNLVIFVH